MLDNVCRDLAQITVDLKGIIAVNAGNKVWAFAKIGLILFAPLNPFVVFITRLHLETSSPTLGLSRQSVSFAKLAPS